MKMNALAIVAQNTHAHTQKKRATSLARVRLDRADLHLALVLGRTATSLHLAAHVGPGLVPTAAVGAVGQRQQCRHAQ